MPLTLGAVLWCTEEAGVGTQSKQTDSLDLMLGCYIWIRAELKEALGPMIEGEAEVRNWRSSKEKA